MADAALKVVLKLVGYPTAPTLLRRVPLASNGLQSLPSNFRTQSVLSGMKYRVISLINDDEIRSGLEEIITKGGGVIDSSSDGKVDGILCDTRGIDKMIDLTKIHSQLNPCLSQINRSGKLLLIGGDTIQTSKNYHTVTASEAVGGFAKSIALELGLKGITANALQIPTNISLNSSSIESGTIQFFLSKRSAFVTGQVIPVSACCPYSSDEPPPLIDPTENFAPHTSPSTCSTSIDGNESLRNKFSVENKRVVITGAARGIGEYTSRLYAAEGAKVLLVDHPSMESQLKSLASELGGKYLPMDVTNERSPELLHQSISESFQPTSSNGSLLDIVVHNAGITRDKTFNKMKEDQFRSVIDVNLASILRLDEMLLCRKNLIMGHGSRLVYLSSIAGIAGGFGQTNYACSKAGVVGYVASRAKEVAAWGIGVNAIAPGFIETEMTKAIPFAIRNVGRRMNALNQGGYPADIAEAAVFLSSPASEALNGVTMRVCGKHRVGA